MSRLIASAFNFAESYEESYAMECSDCPSGGPHAVINAFESKEERAEWQIAHHKETGHKVFQEYEITRLRVEIRKTFTL
ncbi:hypothetical protein [Streptomyces sp. NPDC006477]|uniref:DUF7848 domain-containing protein n=1 Tax=Streptomyces sp. NPDC006477 TaxID=3364747 RepID=UPI0036B6A836